MFASNQLTNVITLATGACIRTEHLGRRDRVEKHLQAGMHKTMVEKDVMPTEKALELVTDLGRIGTKAVTFSGGGEPLLHKDIAQIMFRTIECGLDLSIITNGQLLSGERAAALEQSKVGEDFNGLHERKADE
jgi:wyosine [tRNA(Phe)-imidazoG37] synthetase (radical SAM superfamily)